MRCGQPVHARPEGGAGTVEIDAPLRPRHQTNEHPARIWPIGTDDVDWNHAPSGQGEITGEAFT
ncbi:MAG: hypothetical protein LH475_12060 [Cryobacterium sp.]|uniref:hypothetical protein n=1 Tax=Cryobacterium sp. TaxID=1926290 RepID=UPI0018CA5A8E|nr:hypothetical protein [Cryobacterium sp.]MCY7405339.1 hypothetical protein [Cryobacterium sp.]